MGQQNDPKKMMAKMAEFRCAQQVLVSLVVPLGGRSWQYTSTGAV
jgi:hypothetical protein